MAKDISDQERLIVALDLPTAEAAKQLVLQLGDSVCFYKVGLQLFMTGEYFSLISWLQQRQKKIFVDLKFYDVPETVRLAVAQLNNRGIAFATVHGNDAILTAAVAAKIDVKILAVTVLTSLDQGDLDDLGFSCNVIQLVTSRARRALKLGCDGIISSGLEVPIIRQETGDSLLIISPGIRPVANRPADDQKRVVDVRQAFANGADYIVVGRPIRDAASPRLIAEKFQQDIANAIQTREYNT